MPRQLPATLQMCLKMADVKGKCQLFPLTFDKCPTLLLLMSLNVKMSTFCKLKKSSTIDLPNPGSEQSFFPSSFYHDGDGGHPALSMRPPCPRHTHPFWIAFFSALRGPWTRRGISANVCIVWLVFNSNGPFPPKYFIKPLNQTLYRVDEVIVFPPLLQPSSPLYSPRGVCPWSDQGSHRIPKATALSPHRSPKRCGAPSGKCLNGS